MRRNVGQIIVATAIIDDTIGWIIIAIIFSLARARQPRRLIRVGQERCSAPLAFLAVSFTIGRRLVFRLIRWANDHLRQSDVPVITAILLLMGEMALTTHLIGVHTVLGAFVAGVLVGRIADPDPADRRAIARPDRSLFMPVFFGLAGLSADLTVLRDPSLLMLHAPHWC